jgi:hypothetical protein
LLYSVPRRKFFDTTLNWASTASFHLFSNSLFTISIRLDVYNLIYWHLYTSKVK